MIVTSLLTILAVGGWSLEVDGDYARIVNFNPFPISCYVYHEDGDVTPIRVRALSRSYTFYAVNAEAECY